MFAAREQWEEGSRLSQKKDKGYIRIGGRDGGGESENDTTGTNKTMAEGET